MVHRVPHKGRCPECGYVGWFNPGDQHVVKVTSDGGEVKARVTGCPACFFKRAGDQVGPLPELEDLGPDPEGGVRVEPC